MATLVNWNLSASELRKKLLKLSKTKLVNTCKYQKVSSSGSKKDMINRIIAANSKRKATNSDNNASIKPSIAKKKRKKKKEKKSEPPKIPNYFAGIDTTLNTTSSATSSNTQRKPTNYYKSVKVDPNPKQLSFLHYTYTPSKEKEMDYSSTPQVLQRQDQLFRILKQIDIELNGNIMSDDIWRIVADYATGKIIKCKRCKEQFCVLSEGQIYLHIDYSLHANEKDVYFMTSSPPFAEVIYCKECYKIKFVSKLDTDYNKYVERSQPSSTYNWRTTTYGGPSY